MRVEAFLAPPERARAGAVGLHLLVNGRPVRDRQLARAVAHAYGSVLEPGRYPVGAVYVDLPASEVDVNVHPQKAEVRFADARALFDAVTRELHAGLARAFSVPALGGARPWARGPSTGSARRMIETSREAASAALAIDARAADPWQLHEGTPPSTPAMATLAEPSGGAAPASVPYPTSEVALFESAGFYASLEFLGQLRTMFLLCSGNDGL